MRHSGHIRERSDNSFEIRYSLGKDSITDKWRVKTVTFKGTRKEAQRELQRIIRSLDTGAYVDPIKLPVEEYLKQWIENVKSQVSPKTHDRYADIVRYYLIPSFGQHTLIKLTPATIQNGYSVWEAGGRRDGKKGGLSPRTRLHIHRIFSAALKDAVRLRLIVFNPAEAVKAPKAKRTAFAILTIDQSAILLDAVRDKKIYLPVLLALTTGMRRGEICALRWKNVDFNKKTIRVVESLEQSRKGIRFKAPKTERTRAVILPDYAVDELRALKSKQKECFAELGLDFTQDTLVACRFDGDPLWPTSVTHEFMKAIKKLPDLPRVRFHDLRHSHATQLLAEGIHPKIAQERLGHSTITTTLDLYSHVTDTMQGEAALKLDSVFKEAMKARMKKAPSLG